MSKKKNENKLVPKTDNLLLLGFLWSQFWRGYLCFKMAGTGFGTQLQVRQNAEEIGDFMKDLGRWETDIKKKDEELKSSKAVTDKNLPPIRNQSKKKKSKTKKKETVSKDGQKGPNRINSYDYRSWDRFNVEEELKAIDDKDEMETLTSSSSDEEEYQEIIENERRLQRAVMEKDKGNDLFKEGKYEEAINCYTLANQLDPSNAIMPANRAMALLKIDRYGAAEEDCSLALTIDNTYTKAYLRRAMARFHLNKPQESLTDYQEALKLEPGNKQAQQEIAKLHKILNIDQDNEKEKTEDTAENTRQTVPLKRIHIDEIGSDSSEDDSDGTAQMRAQITTNDIRIDNTNEWTQLSQSSSRITEIVTSDKKPSIEEKSLNNVPKSNDEIVQKGNEENVHKPKEESVQTPNKDSVQKLKNEPQNVKEIKKVISKKVFNVPKTSMQLQADWKVLKDHPQELFEYMKKINPSSFTKLFQQSIDSDMLRSIIQIFHDFYMPAGLPVFSELQNLSKVQRFGMAIMFLSENHKQVLRSLFSYVQENNGCSSESFEILKKKYGV